MPTRASPIPNYVAAMIRQQKKGIPQTAESGVSESPRAPCPLGGVQAGEIYTSPANATRSLRWVSGTRCSGPGAGRNLVDHLLRGFQREGKGGPHTLRPGRAILPNLTPRSRAGPSRGHLRPARDRTEEYAARYSPHGGRPLARRAARAQGRRPAAQAEEAGDSRPVGLPAVWGLAGGPGSIRLFYNLIFAKPVDDALVLDPRVAGDDEEVVRALGHDLPERGLDLYSAEALLVGALADEWHRVHLGNTVVDDFEHSLVRVPKHLLVLLTALVTRGSHVRQSPLPRVFSQNLLAGREGEDPALTNKRRTAHRATPEAGYWHRLAILPNLTPRSCADRASGP